MLNIDPEKLLTLPGKVTVYWMDKNERYLGCNDYMAKLLFCQPADVIGKNTFEFDSVRKEDASIAQQANQFVLANRMPKQFDESYIGSDFSFQFCTLKMPLLGLNNKLLGLVGISQVIKERFLGKQGTIKTQLSLQETACIKLLVLGKTAKEIAKHLGLSYRTVEHYLDNAKMKMSVSNRVQLSQKFLEKYENGGKFGVW